MSRLPTPGGDDGSWGDVLNDFLSQVHQADGTLKPNTVSSTQIQTGAVTKAMVGLANVDNTADADKPISTAVSTFLAVEHNADGTLKQSSAISGAEQKSNKGQANGYASLDANSLVPAAQLATGTTTGAKFLRDDRTWSTVPTGSGGARAATIVVAANDSPAAAKSSADYVCTGSNDHTTLQTAYDALPTNGGDIYLESGTYNITATWNLTKANTRVIFAGGANVRWLTVTGTSALIQVKASKIRIMNPKCQGSGSKGNGIGILLVTDTTGCHDCSIIDPEMLNLDTGIEYGIVGNNSTGDCATYGGAIHDCRTGIKNKGFTNRAFGSRIYSCNICVDCTNDRTSQKFEGYGLTINQWSQQAIRIRNGQGSIFENTWLEHTDSSLLATEAVLIGGHTSIGDTTNREVLGVRFSGTTKITMETETYAFRLYNCRDLLVENLVISTNGNPPSGAVVRGESTLNGTNNRFKHIALMPGSGGKNTFPTGTYPTVLSNVGTATSEIIVEQQFDVENTNAGTTIGGGVTPNTNFMYTVFKETRNGSTLPTYYAKKANGHIAAFAADKTSPVTSGLRAVLVALAADYTSFYFPAGVYSFPEDPAGSEDHWAPNGFTGLAVEGDPSRGTILSNWRDDSQAGYDPTPDVEPFSFTRCNDLVYRNFRVWAGGNQDSNNSSDATDFDSCRGTKLENLVIERSRARGIVYDGGDKGAVSRRSHIKNCEIRGVPVPPNVYAGSAGSVTAQDYRYVVTFVDSLYGETPPSEYTAYTASGTAQIRLTIPTGPAYDATRGVTARKIYRWSTAQPTYRLLTTIPDNTTTIYNDTASDASIAAAATVPLTGTPLIPKEGIKLLGSQRNLVAYNEIVGVGSHGIQIVRKGSDATSNVNSDGHRVIGNTIRMSGAGTTTSALAGIYIGGGSFANIHGNNISNVGTVANQGYGIYVQGLIGAGTEYNSLGPNIIYDDQTANTPTGGITTRYGINLNTVGGGTQPDNTFIVPSAIKGMATAAINDASSTNTRQYSETTHTHTGAGFAAQVVPLWKTGLYYGARSSMAHGTIAGQALTANQIFAAPMYVPADKTVTTIACDVATLAAGTNIRMGIYTSTATDGRPGTLVAGSETATISAATAGLKTATISAALTGGNWYWVCVVSDGTPSITGFTGSQPNFMGSVSPSSGTRQSALRAAIGAGWTALPANFPGAPSETATTLTVEVTF